MAQRDVVQRWLALPHAGLVDEVARLVKQGDGEARRCWAAVRGHQVLAGRVRGILSALRREKADHRDAGMWQVWITQAREVLKPIESSAPPPAPASPSVPVATEGRPRATNQSDQVVPAVVFQPAGE